MHGFDVAMHVEADGFGGKEFSAEVLRLLTHGLGKCAASGATDAWIVDHLIGDGDLSAEIVFLENQHAISGTGQIQSRRQTSGTTADDYDIVQIISRHNDSLRALIWMFKGLPGGSPDNPVGLD